MDCKDYEEKLEKEREINKKYLDEFNTWLNEKNLTKKTIENHVMI